MNRFDPEKFDGKISFGAKKVDISFTARIGPDSRLVIDPIPVMRDLYFALTGTIGQVAETAKYLSISATSKRGDRFSSDRVVVGGGSQANGFSVSLTSQLAQFEFQRADDTKDESSFIKMELRGFRGFRGCSVPTKLGLLVVSGRSDLKSSDDVCGSIVIVSNEPNPSDEWYDRAESFLELIRRGLQFGQGGFLQVPLLQVYRPTACVATIQGGYGQQSHLAVIHPMDQAGYIQALVERVDQDDLVPDAVWLAVEWLNSVSGSHAARYVTLMTAAETLVENLCPDRLSTIMPKGDFRKVAQVLRIALAGTALQQGPLARFDELVLNMNRSTLRDKIAAITQKYAIPNEIFDMDNFAKLNKERNNIIHKGKPSEGVDLWGYILKIRELVTYVILAEIGYAGQYQSYVAGHQSRLMPRPPQEDFV